MNKYKKLVTNTLIFAVGSFGSKILLLFLTRLYTANLNPSDISTKELLELTANFLIPVITFSIADAVIRYGIDQNYDNRKVFTSACVAEGGGVLLLLVLTPFLTLLPYTDGYVLLLMIYCITSGFRQIAQQFVRARGLLRLFAFDGIAAALTLFLFNLIFISGLHMGITGFMLSVILSDLCSGLFLWAAAGLRRFFSLQYLDKQITRTMLWFSIPLIPSALLWLVTGFSDRLFIRYMPGPSGLVGETAAGIYSVSSKIPNLISTISTIFFQAWNMSAIEEVDSKDRGRFYQKIFDTYQSFMFIAGAFLIVFVQILSNILIDSSFYAEYSQAYRYTPVLIVGVTMMCFNQFLSSVYTATQHTTHSFWTSLIAAVVNIVLNIVLIYLMGIMGAAIATFVSYFVSYCIRIVDARRYIYFPVNHAKFIVNTGILFLLGIVVVDEPPMWILILAVGLIFMTIYNFSAVSQTMLQFRRKRR
ncbi:MAG: polysaccharide biosynthesis C-terminal domain-containing protein [Ruminococcus sp.]|nr:polysaccharide biosynthesis C-terminal domain-containing protein [Ruminococcus sp.]